MRTNRVWTRSSEFTYLNGNKFVNVIVTIHTRTDTSIIIEKPRRIIEDQQVVGDAICPALNKIEDLQGNVVLW